MGTTTVKVRRNVRRKFGDAAKNVAQGVTNGFVKKTQKTPPEEIRLAKERRADYIERMG